MDGPALAGSGDGCGLAGLSTERITPRPRSNG
jgi:hypothetical protein